MNRPDDGNAPPIDTDCETAHASGELEPRPVPFKETEFYKVPHRFDLSTMFAVTFAYAGFLGLMNAVGAPLELTASLLVILTVVGLVQMIVSERRARLAAIACGWVGLGGMYGYMLVADPPPSGSGTWVTLPLFVLLFGALLGYIAGTVVAGVFLIADYLRRAVAALRGAKR